METRAQSSSVTLAEAMELAWLEADLLDSVSYGEWLSLWTPDALYVVPVDPSETDFENALNYAYDDHDRRKKRVERLVSGQAVSTSPLARTVRVLSRFRLLAANDQTCTLRCAQLLTESRRERERSYSADVLFHYLRGAGGDLRIRRKVVRLINAGDVLAGIGYVL